MFVRRVMCQSVRKFLARSKRFSSGLFLHATFDQRLLSWTEVWGHLSLSLGVSISKPFIIPNEGRRVEKNISINIHFSSIKVKMHYRNCGSLLVPIRYRIRIRFQRVATLNEIQLEKLYIVRRVWAHHLSHLCLVCLSFLSFPDMNIPSPTGNFHSK